jgi:antirestriction protein ArdC
MEELVAELGAAFLCADLRITGEPRADHAQYLASWLAVLKVDKKAIFTAASKASEAAAFLAALQPLPTRNAGMRCAVPPVIYKDHRGNRLPSVTTIIGRFKESGGLL